MTPEERSRAIAMWGIALCLFAAAAGWMFMRFGQAWSVADLPESENITRIVPAYIITEVAMIPVGGKLIDIYGCKRILVIAPIIFIIASMLCILSLSVEMLVVFRLIQGIGAGMVLALAFTAVGRLYAPTKRGKCHELMTGSFAFGSLFGSAIGYFLTETFNWRCGFIVLSIIMAVGLILALKNLPEDEGSGTKVDMPGMILVALLFGTAATYTQMVNADFDLISLPSFAFVAAIIVLLVLLFRQVRTSDNPVIPIGISAFEKKLILLMFMFSLCGLGLIQYFFKLYLTYYDFDIYDASFMFMYLILGAAGPSIIGSRKVFVTGIRPWLLVGTVLVTISLIASHFLASTGVVYFALSLFLFGAGLGCIVTEILCSLQTLVDKKDMGQHTGNLMAVRMIGILVGNAIVGAYIGEIVRSNYVPTIIDLNITTDLVKQLVTNLVKDVQYAADALNTGLMSTLLIMAVITALLSIVAYKIGKEDLDYISASMDQNEE